VRQRESYGQMHILPVFAKLVTHALDVRALQQFSTSLQNNLSPKTVVNILEIDLMPLRRTTWHENGLQSGLKDTGAAVFAVLRYAKKSGMTASSVSFSDLTLRAAETQSARTLRAIRLTRLSRPPKSLTRRCLFLLH